MHVTQRKGSKFPTYRRIAMKDTAGSLHTGNAGNAYLPQMDDQVAQEQEHQSSSESEDAVRGEQQILRTLGKPRLPRSSRPKWIDRDI